MKRRNKVILIIIVLLLFGIFIWNVVSKQMEKREDVEDKMQIGMVFDSLVIERWVRDRDIFVSTAKELGAEVNVQNSNGDIKKQKEQIDYFIKKGMDAIVIICADSYELRDYVKKAKDAGIKVIAYDRLIADADVDLFISFDSALVGTLMGKVLVEQGLVNKKVLMLGGPLTDHNVTLMENAFKKVMEENQITILDSVHAESWRAEVASQYVYDHVDVVAEADAIMCGNDNLASMVISALAEKRMAGDVLVVGQDGELEACQRIVEGTQLMTAYKPIDKLARQAAEYTVQLIKEGKISGDNVLRISDGRYNIPYVGIEPISVTKENMNEIIIESGFHLKEEVYLNVPEMMAIVE